jgi:hypothetical protein
MKLAIATIIVAASATPAAAQMYTDPNPLQSSQPVNVPGHADAILHNPATMNTMVTSLLAPPACGFSATFQPPLPWQVNGVGTFAFSVDIAPVASPLSEACAWQIGDTIGIGGTIVVRVVVGAGGGISVQPDPIDVGNAPIGGGTPATATAYNDTGLLGEDPLFWDWLGPDADQFRMTSPCISPFGGAGCTSPSFGPPDMISFAIRCEPTTGGPKAATLQINGMFGGMGYATGQVPVLCNTTAPGPDANTNVPDADTSAPDADPNAPDADPNAPDGAGGGLTGDTTNYYACGCNGDTGRGTGGLVALALLVIFRRRGSS